MAYSKIPTRSTVDANASADPNQLQENINQMIDGTGTSMSSHTMGQLSPTSQSGAPSSTPSITGMFNLDTTANRLYISTGTSSSADWDRLPYNDYGTETVTAGGGDVVVTLPRSWEGGVLIIFRTDTAADYMSDEGSGADGFYITSYDSLTNASYTASHTYGLNAQGDSIRSIDKTDASSGNPNAATPLSFTLDDDGANTRYIRWMVIA